VDPGFRRGYEERASSCKTGFIEDVEAAATEEIR
jgi:hypothetical protein